MSASNATADAVALCVSELVTNALDHAAPPVRRVVEPSALRGRGLHFVEQSARSWGVSATSGGKTVWAEFGLAGR